MAADPELTHDGFTWAVEATAVGPGGWRQDVRTRAIAGVPAFTKHTLTGLGIGALMVVLATCMGEPPVQGLLWAVIWPLADLLVHGGRELYSCGRHPRTLELRGRWFQLRTGTVLSAEGPVDSVSIAGRHLTVGGHTYEVHGDLAWLEAHLAERTIVPHGSVEEVPAALKNRASASTTT